MKKLLLMTVILSACGRSADKDAEWAEMQPGVKYSKFDFGVMFGADGCLLPEYAQFYPCLGTRTGGCIRRDEYDAFTNLWRYRTPKPDIPLCDQL